MNTITGLKIITARLSHPPRLLIHGLPGSGKTSLAIQFPEPIMLDTEGGMPAGVSCPSFGLLESYDALYGAVADLYVQPHDFRTVLLDSASETEKLIFAEVCGREGKDNIADFPYGRGYQLAGQIWQELLDGLMALRRDRGTMVVVVAHSRIARFNDPETAAYDRYEIDLHSRLVGRVERLMDAILMIKRPTSIITEDAGFNKKRARGESGNHLFIHTVGRPSVVAKNRFGMPEKIRFDPAPGAGWAALEAFLPPMEKGKDK